MGMIIILAVVLVIIRTILVVTMLVLILDAGAADLLLEHRAEARPTSCDYDILRCSVVLWYVLVCRMGTCILELSSDADLCDNHLYTTANKCLQCSVRMMYTVF